MNETSCLSVVSYLDLFLAATFCFPAELTFQLRNTPDEFREMLNGDHLALGLLVRLRGDAQPFATVGNVVHYPGFRGDGDLVADFQMPGEADLAGEDHVFAQLGAAGNADL